MSRRRRRRYAPPREWTETDKRCLKLTAAFGAWVALILGGHLWGERP